MVALLSPGWMPSNPTESFPGAPGCLTITVRWLLATVLMQTHTSMRSPDTVQSRDQKRAYRRFHRKKNLPWNAVKVHLLLLIAANIHSLVLFVSLDSPL